MQRSRGPRHVGSSSRELSDRVTNVRYSRGKLAFRTPFLSTLRRECIRHRRISNFPLTTNTPVFQRESARRTTRRSDDSASRFSRRNVRTLRSRDVFRPNRTASRTNNRKLAVPSLARQRIAFVSTLGRPCVFIVTFRTANHSRVDAFAERIFRRSLGKKRLDRRQLDSTVIFIRLRCRWVFPNRYFDDTEFRSLGKRISRYTRRKFRDAGKIDLPRTRVSFRFTEPFACQKSTDFCFQTKLPDTVFHPTQENRSLLEQRHSRRPMKLFRAEKTRCSKGSNPLGRNLLPVGNGFQASKVKSPLNQYPSPPSLFQRRTEFLEARTFFREMKKMRKPDYQRLKRFLFLCRETVGFSEISPKATIFRSETHSKNSWQRFLDRADSPTRASIIFKQRTRRSELPKILYDRCSTIRYNGSTFLDEHSISII